MLFKENVEMKRAVAYGKGKVFSQNIEKLSNINFTAIVDENAQEDERYDSISVVHPSNINYNEYDYIVIFSDKYFYEIVGDLVWKYGVELYKIYSYEQFIIPTVFEFEDFTSALQYSIKGSNARHILDFEESPISKYLLNRNSIIKKGEYILDYYATSQIKMVNDIYDSIIYNDVHNPLNYDAIICWKINEEERNLIENKIACRWIFFVSTENNISTECELVNSFDTFKTAFVVPFRSGKIFAMRRSNIDGKKNEVAIYVVLHKDYQVFQNSIMKPFCVGGYYHNGYLSEREKDNISSLNEKINECTALYWMWKNTNEGIVGLCHYRRYFCEQYENFFLPVREEYVSALLQQNDIILAKAVTFSNMTISEQLEDTIPNKKILDTTFQLFRNRIAIKQPDYIEIFDYVMQKKSFYPYNMFITTREVFSRYCEWLFSFLLGIAEAINVTGCDPISRRVVGYFAERMMTVWMVKQKLKIIELPVFEK